MYKSANILFPFTHVRVCFYIVGLNEIVPDNLLSMFDENELEVFAWLMNTVHVNNRHLCSFSLDIHSTHVNT